jgi:uncharacterized membrane protein YeiH
MIFDAVGLSLCAVTGATQALQFGLGPVPAILLGTITGIGGGMLRDVLLGEIPTILREGLYTVPALLGAAVLVVAREGRGRTSLLIIFVLDSLARDCKTPVSSTWHNLALSRKR